MVLGQRRENEEGPTSTERRDGNHPMCDGKTRPYDPQKLSLCAKTVMGLSSAMISKSICARWGIS
jgi:hypothetical protein